MNFFIRVKGKPFGPFDETQITEMKSKGKIFKNTELSNDRVNWFPAETQSWLFPPAAPQQEQFLPSIGGASGTSNNAAEPATWFYSLDGQNGYGPVPIAAITKMLQDGTLAVSSYVWQEGENARFIKDEPVFSGGQVAPSAPTVYSPPSHQGGVRYCTTCGEQMQPTARMCMKCGTESRRGARQFCSVCGSPTVPTARMCVKCGSPVGGGFTNFTYQGTTPSSMGIGYFDVWKKYVTFHGRARRKEYWMFALINSLIGMILYFVGFVFVIAGQEARSDGMAIIGGLFILVYFVFAIAVFLPSLAVLFRRLHDAGYSGWLWLLGCIPFFGGIILLVFCVQDSQPDDNQYGPNPKHD